MWTKKPAHRNTSKRRQFVTQCNPSLKNTDAPGSFSDPIKNATVVVGAGVVVCNSDVNLCCIAGKAPVVVPENFIQLKTMNLCNQ